MTTLHSGEVGRLEQVSSVIDSNQVLVLNETGSIVLARRDLIGGPGSSDTPEQIRDKLQTLTDDNRLSVSAVNGAITGSGTSGALARFGSTSGVLEDSSVVESGPAVTISDKELIITNPRSVQVGPSTRLSDGGGLPEFSDPSVVGSSFSPVIVDKSTGPTGEPFYVKVNDDLKSDAIQGDDSSGANNTFTYTVSGSAEVIEYTVRGNTNLTGCRAVFRRNDQDGIVYYQTISDARYNSGEGFTLSDTGDTVISLEVPFRFNDGEVFHVTIESTQGTPVLKGDGIIPFFSRRFRTIENVNLITSAPSTGGTYNDIVYINRNIPVGFFDSMVQFTYPLASYTLDGFKALIRLRSSSVARTVYVQVVNSGNPSISYFAATLSVDDTETVTFDIPRTATDIPTTDLELAVIAASASGGNVSFVGFIETGGER